MKKRTILFTILIFMFSKTDAQKGFSGSLVFGITASQVDGDEQSGYKKPGLFGGVFVERPVTKNGSFKTGLCYSGKGAVLNRDYPDGTTVQIFKTSLHYIEIPVFYKLEILEKVNIAAGIIPSYLFAAKQTSYKAEVPDFENTLSPFDIQPSGEVNFYFSDKLQTGLRFSYSLLNLGKIPTMSFYNNNVNLFFVYMLKNKK